MKVYSSGGLKDVASQNGHFLWTSTAICLTLLSHPRQMHHLSGLAMEVPSIQSPKDNLPQQLPFQNNL